MAYRPASTGPCPSPPGRPGSANLYEQPWRSTRPYAVISYLPVDGLALLDVVQQAEIQRFQMIAARLRWPPLHTEEPDNGRVAVVAAIRVRHEGLEKLGSRGFDVLQDSIALPLQQRREG